MVISLKKYFREKAKVMCCQGESKIYMLMKKKLYFNEKKKKKAYF